jgi:PST family polysaccharide transporter
MMDVPVDDDMVRRPRSVQGALAWTYAGLVAKIVCQFGFGIGMARLLGPEPYGLVACSAIVVSLAGLLSDGGVTASLIQASNPTRREIAGAWWLQMGLGCGLWLAIAAIAPWVMARLAIPEAAPVLQVSALAFPINAIASTSIALLRRSLRIKPIQIAITGSYLVAYGAVGLPLAWWGAGVWAIVSAQLLQTAIQMMIVVAFMPPCWRSPILPRRMVGFGFWTVLSNILCWFHANFPQIVASHVFGLIALGGYNRLALITDTTVPIIIGPVQQVLFPALAHVDSGSRRDRMVRSAFKGTALIFLPAMLILALYPQVLVSGLFSQRFAASADLLVPMALSTLAMSLACLPGTILSAAGHPRDELISHALALPSSVALILAMSRYGMGGLCWGLCIATWIRLVIIITMARLAGVLLVRDVVLGVLAVLPAAIAGIAGAAIGDRLGGGTAGLVHVAILVGVALAMWAVSLLFCWRFMLPEPVVEKIQPYVLKFPSLPGKRVV